jgi:hypothetical protein
MSQAHLEKICWQHVKKLLIRCTTEGDPVMLQHLHALLTASSLEPEGDWVVLHDLGVRAVARGNLAAILKHTHLPVMPRSRAELVCYLGAIWGELSKMITEQRWWRKQDDWFRARDPQLRFVITLFVSLPRPVSRIGETPTIGEQCL